MSTQQEEVLMRLGFATDSLEAGARQMKANMGETAEHIVEHMRGPRGAMRAFHHLITEVTATSPLLGAGLQAAFNPVTGIVLAGVLALKSFLDSLKEANKEMDKMEESAAKGVGNMPEALSKAGEEIAKTRREFAQFQEKAEAASEPSEEDRAKRQIDLLKEKYGEDKAGFLQAKAELLAQQSEIAKTTGDYEKQRAASLEVAAVDKDRVAKLKDINEQLKQSEERLKELEKEKPVSKAGVEIRSLSDIQGDLMAEHERRNRLEERSRSLVEQQLDLKEQLKEAESSAVKHLERANQLENERAQTVAEASANKARIDKETFDEEEKDFEAAKLREEELITLQREINAERKKRQQEQNVPFMPTIEKLAASGPRDVAADATARIQRESDAFAIGAGATYAARFSEDAQKLLMAQDDAKRALLIEGPNSTRYKDDIKQIDSLKKGLSDAGLRPADSKLESIDNHLAALLERAEGHGLKIQPVMIE